MYTRRIYPVSPIPPISPIPPMSPISAMPNVPGFNWFSGKAEKDIIWNFVHEEGLIVDQFRDNMYL